MKKAAANRVKRKTARQWRAMRLLSEWLILITLLIIIGVKYAI